MLLCLFSLHKYPFLPTTISTAHVSVYSVEQEAVRRAPHWPPLLLLLVVLAAAVNSSRQMLFLVSTILYIL